MCWSREQPGAGNALRSMEGICAVNSEHPGAAP
jgi:hypothetical protein